MFHRFFYDYPLTLITYYEILEYEKHPIYGYNITSKIKQLSPEAPKVILAHHENCSGTGFPLDLSSSYISKLAKIIALADSFDTLHRQHHIFETLRILLENKLTAFHPELVFINLFEERQFHIVNIE